MSLHGFCRSTPDIVKVLCPRISKMQNRFTSISLAVQIHFYIPCLAHSDGSFMLGLRCSVCVSLCVSVCVCASVCVCLLRFALSCYSSSPFLFSIKFAVPAIGSVFLCILLYWFVASSFHPPSPPRALCLITVFLLLYSSLPIILYGAASGSVFLCLAFHGFAISFHPPFRHLSLVPSPPLSSPYLYLRQSFVCLCLILSCFLSPSSIFSSSHLVCCLPLCFPHLRYLP